MRIVLLWLSLWGFLLSDSKSSFNRQASGQSIQVTETGWSWNRSGKLRKLHKIHQTCEDKVCCEEFIIPKIGIEMDFRGVGKGALSVCD